MLGQVNLALVTNPLAPAWLDESVDANALVPGIWADAVSRDGSGEISIAGVSVSALAHRFSTPLYVIDEDHAKAREMLLTQLSSASVRAPRSTTPAKPSCARRSCAGWLMLASMSTWLAVVSSPLP